MYSLGQAVVTRMGDSPQVGEVVGVRAASQGTLYDVSLEQVVYKAVAQDDLRLATADELNSLLTSLMGSAGGALGSAASERDALLRQEHVSFLVHARALLEDEPSLAGAVQGARHAVGDYVAVRQADAIVLGRVVGVSMRNGELRYTLEAMGETIQADEHALGELSDVAMAGGVALGSRARFVAPGYEDDDAFLGIVCSFEQTEDGPVFALLFDDGDVLEGLRPADLQRLPV